MKRERNPWNKRNGFFFSLNLDPHSSLFTPPRKKKKKRSHVRVLLPLHALRLGDPAAQLHTPGLPRQQRVRAAQPDAAVVDREGRRRREPRGGGGGGWGGGNVRLSSSPPPPRGGIEGLDRSEREGGSLRCARGKKKWSIFCASRSLRKRSPVPFFNFFFSSCKKLPRYSVPSSFVSFLSLSLSLSLSL